MDVVRDPNRANPPLQDYESELADRAELIEQLLAIGTALSKSTDLEELLHLILSKSREITCSDAGSVYLIDRSDDHPKLVFKAAQNDSIPAASFREFAIPITPESLAGYVASTGESLILTDAYTLPADVPYRLDQKFDRDFSYRTCSVLMLPMQNQEGEVTGVLQLINRKIDRHLKITPENALAITKPYTEWEERIIRSLASQAAISIERTHLQDSIENLFEGFVRASVQIIEARDPTTSGHSERVAELTVRLALEVNEIHAGALQKFYFGDRQIQEIRYAALLHDFGKVGVPEAILNKRQKLYPDQLEAIRYRFALAQRSLELDCAQKKFKYLFDHAHVKHSSAQAFTCPHCHQLAQLDTQMSEAIATLERYWTLILHYNEPEAIPNKEFEALTEETLAQLTALSQHTYRDLDGQLKPLLTEPEMAQLLLPRGNLNNNERRAIEAHVTHTYEFLKRIPWTKHLKNVPRIAYGHHEKLDGSGYPLGLNALEIPLQTQIMTIADIYDALTASDRPYKRRLSIETSLKILYGEAHKGKINQDLVELFEQRQVFQVLGHILNSEANSAA